MRDYKMLSQIYDKKFLNYIINRSKILVRRYNLEYEDLIQEGILKLVELYHTDKNIEDPVVMASLKRMFHDIHESHKNAMPTMTLDDLLLREKVEAPFEPGDTFTDKISFTKKGGDIE